MPVFGTFANMETLRSLIATLCLLATVQTGQAQKKVDIVTFDWYKQLRKSANDTTYVVNFWATWCMPCIAELPEFERFRAAHLNEPVKVILVSLDYYKKLGITVLPFLDKQKIQSAVVLLNEPDYNSWIDKVDKTWQGSIPATVVFNNKTKAYRFHEGELTTAELEKYLTFMK